MKKLIRILAALCLSAAAAFAQTNIRNCGAIGDGIADDSAAINAAFQQVAQSGGTIYVPAGTYRISSQSLSLSGNVTVRGDGPQASRFIFENDKRFTYSGARIENYDIGTTRLTLDSVGFFTNTAVSGNLLEAIYPNMYAGTQHTVTITNVEVAVLSNGFAYFSGAAIYLKNCQGSKIDNVRIYGGRDSGMLGYGIHIESDEASSARNCEYIVTRVSAYFVGSAVYVTGDVEGVSVQHACFVACKKGVEWPNGRCFLIVSDSHMSCIEQCVASNNLWQVNIHDNLFYICENQASTAIYLGLDSTPTMFQDSHISRNTIEGMGPNKNGIFITGHANVNFVIIDGNIFRNLDAGVLLAGQTGGVLVPPSSNIFANCSNSVLHL